MSEGVSWIRVTPEGPWPKVRDISDKTSGIVIIYAPSWGLDWAVLEYRPDPEVTRRLWQVEETIAIQGRSFIDPEDLKWYEDYQPSLADLQPHEWRIVVRGGGDTLRFKPLEVECYMPIPPIPWKDPASNPRAEANGVIDTLDEMLAAGAFERVGATLYGMNPQKMAPEAISAALVITLPAKDVLGSIRDAFVQRAATALRASHGWSIERVDALVKRLG